MQESWNRGLVGALASTALLWSLSLGASAELRGAETAQAPTMGKPDKAGKPAKVSWSPRRVENADVTDGVITVEISADKEVLGATLWVSGSLTDAIGLPEDPFDIPEGETVEIELELLQTPDEAGRTLGGTVHVFAGKNLAQPLTVSLKQTEQGGAAENGDEDEIVADDGTLPVSWLVGEDDPLEALTLDLFDEDGLAEIILMANRDLENVWLRFTPSVDDCLDAYFPDDLVEEEGVLELTEDGNLKFIAEGTKVPVIVELLKPIEELTSNKGGTLQVRNVMKPVRVWPSPLLVNLVVDDTEEPGEEVAPAAVVDAASFEQRAISAGQIVSIFGSGLGPEKPAVFELNSDGAIGEDLDGTSVLFDGYPGRVLSSSKGQVNVIVPRAVRGSDAELQVINMGKASAPFPVPVGRPVPSLFALDGTGQGQAAAVNADGSLNSNGNPARAGSIILLYGMGAGPSAPALADGEIATGAFPLAGSVQVFIGGVEAEVVYAGTAPGLVGVVTQYNVRIGGGTPKGVQPVRVVVDGFESTALVTIAVM